MESDQAYEGMEYLVLEEKQEDIRAEEGEERRFNRTSRLHLNTYSTSTRKF